MDETERADDGRSWKHGKKFLFRETNFSQGCNNLPMESFELKRDGNDQHYLVNKLALIIGRGGFGDPFYGSTTAGISRVVFETNVGKAWNCGPALV